MAKRASILDVDYNPVGARLRGAIAPVQEARSEGESTPVPAASLEVRQQELLPASPEVPSPLPLRLRRVEPREIKETCLRFRCSDSERKKWHDIAREITGEHNQLSLLLRACLLLLESSYEQLKKISPEMQRIRRPPIQDSLGLALYEQRFAQLLFDAIKAAGRPKA